MKRKFVAFALIIITFVTITSGCYVGYEGGYRYHHEHHYYHHDRD